nr:MAG TPA_asm: hypothetical protein [Caudoviricetes sp.]
MSYISGSPRARNRARTKVHSPGLVVRAGAHIGGQDMPVLGLILPTRRGDLALFAPEGWFESALPDSVRLSGTPGD